MEVNYNPLTSHLLSSATPSLPPTSNQTPFTWSWRKLSYLSFPWFSNCASSQYVFRFWQCKEITCRLDSPYCLHTSSFFFLTHCFISFAGIISKTQQDSDLTLFSVKSVPIVSEVVIFSLTPHPCLGGISYRGRTSIPYIAEADCKLLILLPPPLAEF